jgi:hypothetical protein
MKVVSLRSQSNKRVLSSKIPPLSQAVERLALPSPVLECQAQTLLERLWWPSSQSHLFQDINHCANDGAIQVDNSKSKDEGKDDQTANLESNPKHVLEDAAKDKTSKTVS